jgi:undecaprenyl-diphosphatase
MAAGLFRKLKPEEAARFSFLLSVPAIIGAVVFKAKEVAGGLAGANAGLYFLGLVVSFVLGWASIAVLLRVMRRGRFGLFGAYCVTVGVLGLVLLGPH